MSNLLKKPTTGYIRGRFTEEVIFTPNFQAGVRVEVKDVKGSFRLKTVGREAVQRMVVRLIWGAHDLPGKTRMARCIRKIGGDEWSMLSGVQYRYIHSLENLSLTDPRLKMNQKTRISSLCLLVPWFLCPVHNASPVAVFKSVALFSSFHPFSNKSMLCLCLLRCSYWSHFKMKSSLKGQI